MDQIPPGTDLFQIPYQQPPPGIQSDFNKPSDLRLLFHILIPIMIAIITIFMLFRIRARMSHDERWKLDDWLTLATWATTTGLGFLLIACVQKLGRSTWDVSLGFLLSAWPQRVLLCMAFIGALSLLLGKLSLLALYYRFFGHIDRVRRQLYLTGALCFPLLAACIIFPILAAPPLGKPWGTQNPHNKDNSIVALAVGVVNILADLLILYIPIPVIANMNLSTRKKGGVLAIFLTGSIAIIADGTVMFYRVRLWQGHDPLRSGMIVGLCSFLEACISVVCSSMPCAAKVWKVHIVGSELYVSLRMRFGYSQSNDSSSAPKSSEYDSREKSPKKRRRGLYSIGTLPTTTYSTTQLGKEEGFAELESLKEEQSEHNRVSHDPEMATHSSLTFNDPSNYLAKQSHIV